MGLAEELESEKEEIRMRKAKAYLVSSLGGGRSRITEVSKFVNSKEESRVGPLPHQAGAGMPSLLQL